MASPDAIEIQHVMTITMNHQEWRPKVHTIGGHTLVMISKWDRAFTQFFTGKSLDLRKGKHRSLNAMGAGSFLDDLCKKRRDASIQAALEEYSKCSEDASKKRRRTITKKDEHLCPVVDVTLDAIEDTDGCRVAKVVKMGFAKCGSELWVEASSDVLEHILHGMRWHNANSSHGRLKRSKSQDEVPEDDVQVDPKVAAGEAVLESMSKNSQKWRLWPDEVKASYAAKEDHLGLAA